MIQSVIQNTRNCVDIGATEINFEMVVEIRESVCSAKAVVTWICNWVSKTTNNLKNSR
jgi:hypothetical protein